MPDPDAAAAWRYATQRTETIAESNGLWAAKHPGTLRAGASRIGRAAGVRCRGRAALAVTAGRLSGYWRGRPEAPPEKAGGALLCCALLRCGVLVCAAATQ
ncbi:hypothetical protein GCM10027570_23470 [Streptomonospora sediminis]